MRGREAGKGYFQGSFYLGLKLNVRFVELMREVKSTW